MEWWKCAIAGDAEINTQKVIWTFACVRCHWEHNCSSGRVDCLCNYWHIGQDRTGQDRALPCSVAFLLYCFPVSKHLYYYSLLSCTALRCAALHFTGSVISYPRKTHYIAASDETLYFRCTDVRKLDFIGATREQQAERFGRRDEANCRENDVRRRLLKYFLRTFVYLSVCLIWRLSRWPPIVHPPSYRPFFLFICFNLFSFSPVFPPSHLTNQSSLPSPISFLNFCAGSISARKPSDCPHTKSNRSRTCSANSWQHILKWTSAKQNSLKFC